MAILKKIAFGSLLSFLFTLSGCATSNDLNPPTGNPMAAVAGGAVGAGVAALAGAPKPFIFFAGLGGAGLGYYLSTLRFDARGIIAAGGQVYTLGDYVIIDIPTDALFDANTADFLPNTNPVLHGIVNVLSRFPHHNVIISGNTSGSWTTRFEMSMSLCRAEQVAAYLWSHGIGTTIGAKEVANSPKRTFVGYGNKFPIANDLHIKGIRQNSRIQIVAYLSYEELNWNHCNNCRKNFKQFRGNVESIDQVAREMDLDRYDVSTLDQMPSTELADNHIKFNGRVDGAIPETEVAQSTEFTTDAQGVRSYSSVASDPNIPSSAITQDQFVSVGRDFGAEQRG